MTPEYKNTENHLMRVLQQKHWQIKEWLKEQIPSIKPKQILMSTLQTLLKNMGREVEIRNGKLQ